MADFQNSVDIGNRALQHVGATRMTALTDNSKNAAAVSFSYDKLRRAELRRNCWRFSIRKVALRAIDEDTRILIGAAWGSGTTYGVGAVVSYGGSLWQTTQSSLGETPGANNTSWDAYGGSLTIQPWDTDSSYYVGELVTNGGSVYLSLTSSNEDEPPAATWVSLGLVADVSSDLVILYPMESGPGSNSTTRNAYRLPNNFLRMAPQGPKEGSTSWLGAPSGLAYSDWDLEGDYIVTADPSLILVRYVADVTRVTRMDPMFCEGLGCRIALEICEELTQSSEKLSNIGAQYKLFMGEARTVNAIETGPIEPPEDSYVTCRW